MLKTSIQTSGLLTEKNFDDFDSKFEILEQAGFDALDHNLNIHYTSNDVRTNKRSSFFDLELSELFLKLIPFKKSAYNHKLYFGQLHAPYPSYVVGNTGFINEYMLEVLKKSIALTNFFESEFLVIHPITSSYVTSAEEEKRLNFEMYKSLIPYARTYNVKICLENMFHTTKAHNLCEACCSNAEDAVFYIDSLNEVAGEELFSFCFDLGHANVLGKNIRKSLNTLGQRVRCLHIHDNDARQDLHMIPYSFSTNWGIDMYTDWNGFISGLADIGYNGTLNFEVHQAFHVFPKAVHKEMLTLLNAIGRNFANEINSQMNMKNAVH